MTMRGSGSHTNMESTQRPALLEWAPSLKNDPAKTGFLDLPRELRDLVYSYALQVPGAILVQSPSIYAAGGDLKGRAIKHKGRGLPEPQRLDQVLATCLVRTCRQIHHESTIILYGHNIFSFQMSNANFALYYRTLIRSIMFTVEASRHIYSNNMIDMGYWWRRVFWPNVVDASTKLHERYPDLTSITSPIKSNDLSKTWRPAFMLIQRKTSKQRIDLGAHWLKSNCPIADESLKRILHMEIMPAKGAIQESEFEGSRFAFDDDNDDDDIWDHTEFASAFERMKDL